MSYSSGGVIQANDYNNLAWGGNSTGVYNSTITNLAQVMGVGYGYRGYGQTISAIDAVAATNTVTATQWAGLVYLLNRALGHQSGAAAQLATGSNIGIVAGATISAFANVATAVGTVNTNANLYTAQGSTTTGSNYAQAITGTSATFQNIWTRTITFPSGDAARYFFNAGGQINYVISSATNNNGTLRSADLVTQWATYQASGTIKGISSSRGGSGGTPSTASIGYWGATTATQTICQVTSANYRYEYNSDYTNVRIRTSTQNSSGSGDKGAVVYLDFGSYMFSTYAGLNDDVNVTVNHRIDIVAPESTYLQASWTIPTIT